MTDERTLWIILPTYNEEGSVGPLLDRFRSVLSDLFRYRVVVVNDGSTDRTVEEIQARTSRMPIEVVTNEKNMGLGLTLQRGLEFACGKAGPADFVLTMDADNTHDPALVPDMLARLDEGFDFVVASRYQPGAAVAGLSRSREMISTVASRLFRILFPVPNVRDYTCGYRIYQVKMLRSIKERFGVFTTERGFTCMADILLRARVMRFRGSEVPMNLRYDLKASGSKMKVARTVHRTLLILLKRRLGIWT